MHMANSGSLSGKVAVVTGGTRGLGRGVAQALAARGARVLVVARNAAASEAMASEVPGVVPAAGDAADEGLAERIFAARSPDVVVLCAGGPSPAAALHELSWEQFGANWNVDAKSAFVWLREALCRPMKRGGHVIVVSSGAAIHGSPASGGYAPAKRAQWYMAEYAAAESKRLELGLHVRCLLPHLSPVTERGEAAIRVYADRAGMAFEEYAKRFYPPLTPEIMGRGVADLVEAPDRHPDTVYRVTGAGLVGLS